MVADVPGRLPPHAHTNFTVGIDDHHRAVLVEAVTALHGRADDRHRALITPAQARLLAARLVTMADALEKGGQ